MTKSPLIWKFEAWLGTWRCSEQNAPLCLHLILHQTSMQIDKRRSHRSWFQNSLAKQCFRIDDGKGSKRKLHTRRNVELQVHYLWFSSLIMHFMHLPLNLKIEQIDSRNNNLQEACSNATQEGPFISFLSE